MKTEEVPLFDEREVYSNGDQVIYKDDHWIHVGKYCAGTHPSPETGWLLIPNKEK